MKEYDFYEYYEYDDKLKIYSDDLFNYFQSKFNIIIDSIDFDLNQNVILFIEDVKNKVDSLELEKNLLETFEHLNDVEVKSMKIILTFGCKEIEIC